MNIPRSGVGLPTFGSDAGPESVVFVAQAAERLGFDSVSATERLLLPAAPDWDNEFGLPDSYAWDTLEMLVWAAAHTRRIRLGTGVINSLFQPPIVLARRLATIDRLSGGRLDVGIGQGWLPEEFTATGVPISRRGAGFEEHLAAMRACWGPDPVEHDGPRYRIPRAKVGPKPVQTRLPVLIGAVARPAVERAARIGDGFITALRDWAATRTEIAWYRDAGGTGPVVLRAGLMQGNADPSAFPSVIAATAIDMLGQATDAGIDEVHFDLTLAGLDPDRQVTALEAIASSLKLSGAVDRVASPSGAA